MHFHPVSSTKAMGFLHPLQVYLKLQVSSLSSFDKLSGEQALPYQQEPVVLELVVVVAELVNFEQPMWDHVLVPELLELEPDFELQDPEPDLQDPVLHLQFDLGHLD